MLLGVEWFSGVHKDVHDRKMNNKEEGLIRLYF